MLIDWFTVAAQVINFLVLVWLLKRFLYRPILDAVDAREQRVAARLADAEARERAAGEARSALEAERASLARERAARLAAADAEAEAAREALLAQARDDAAELAARLEAALTLERESEREALTRRIGTEVVALAGQVLQDLAGESIQEHMAAALLERLRRLPADERAALAAALAGVGRAPLLRTAAPLPAPMQQAYARAVAELAPESAPLRFEVAADLVGGAELVTDGHRFAWTVADYLDGLRRLLFEPAAAPRSDDDAGRAA